MHSEAAAWAWHAEIITMNEERTAAVNFFIEHRT
jgi:hypothetical protein